MINNNRRRNFRPRPQKSGFRRRNGHPNQSQNNHFNSNGNNSFARNGSMSNPVNVEKTIQKFQQLAKDAQSGGDLVLVQNYLQHADHYTRRLAELNFRDHNNNNSIKDSQKIEEKANNIQEEAKEEKI
jgi:hypothetical protein|tara:strand:- start:45 stop:428 length:384 start_codon:yes stop_codon:yes gene_type:complete